jgi:hypothetical protein
MKTLDFDVRYRVARWPAVAVYVAGYPQTWEAYTYLCTDDDGNEWEEPSDEGEWIDDLESGDVLVVMVGDDRKHRVSIDDLIALDDLDYCAECGQIGCGHDGRDRS